MPKTVYLGDFEDSPRNAKIRAIQDRDIRLGEDSTAGDVLDLLLDDRIDRIGDVDPSDFAE